MSINPVTATEVAAQMDEVLAQRDWALARCAVYARETARLRAEIARLESLLPSAPSGAPPGEDNPETQT